MFCIWKLCFWHGSGNGSGGLSNHVALECWHAAMVAPEHGDFLPVLQLCARKLVSHSELKAMQAFQTINNMVLVAIQAVGASVFPLSSERWGCPLRATQRVGARVALRQGCLMLVLGSVRSKSQQESEAGREKKLPTSVLETKKHALRHVYRGSHRMHCDGTSATSFLHIVWFCRSPVGLNYSRYLQVSDWCKTVMQPRTDI